MRPQIQNVADPFGVRVIPSGGFSSVTARRNTSLRLIEESLKRDVHMLLIGDYDPSGQSIIDSTCEDVSAFGVTAEFEHLAVTPEQAEKYSLQSAPQKETDRRGEYMADTYQAEALDPGVLAGIVRTRLLELIGDGNVTDAEEQTKRERKKILADIDELSRSRQQRGGKGK